MGAPEVEFTAKEVAAHKTREECWMTIHGQGELPRIWGCTNSLLTKNLQSTTSQSIWMIIQGVLASCWMWQE